MPAGRAEAPATALACTASLLSADAVPAPAAGPPPRRDRTPAPLSAASNCREASPITGRPRRPPAPPDPPAPAVGAEVAAAGASAADGPTWEVVATGAGAGAGAVTALVEAAPPEVAL